jgi:hypothetical protein
LTVNAYLGRLLKEHEISNIEQGISKSEVKVRAGGLFPSNFDIPCSIFDIRIEALRRFFSSLLGGEGLGVRGTSDGEHKA